MGLCFSILCAACIPTTRGEAQSYVHTSNGDLVWVWPTAGVLTLTAPITLPLGSVAFSVYAVSELVNGRLLSSNWAIGELAVGLLTLGMVALAGAVSLQYVSMDRMDPPWLGTLVGVGVSSVWNVVHAIWSLGAYT